jgi:hypothetical protein
LVHQQFYQNIGHAPNRSTSLDPELQNKNKCAPLDYHLFSLYPWELNFGQTIRDKTQVLLGTSSGAHLGTVWELDARTLRTGKPFGDMVGTHWEQGGGRKYPCPRSPSKRKKTATFVSAC